MSVRRLLQIKDIQGDYGYDEAVRTLRTNLLFSGSNVKVILFTSSLPGEGKSSISFSVARSLAQIGKRTVLIDADIRKSILRQCFEAEGEIDGLSQYLSGQCTLEDIVLQTSDENLVLIFAGAYSPNPAELLEDDLCRRMFGTLRQEYDYIIVDTPPMANLADGAIVARNCDGAVVVIESGAVSYKLEQRVKKQLEKTGCRILGAVLNKVDIREKGYYGKYGKYGKYEYESEKVQKKSEKKEKKLKKKAGGAGKKISNNGEIREWDEGIIERLDDSL